MNSDVRKLLRKVRKQGGPCFEHGGHVRVFGPGGAKPFIVVPTTPSDHRTLKNCVAMLRREHGYDL